MFARDAVTRDSGCPTPERATPAAVARLIAANLPYAHALAAEVTRKLPAEVDRRDIQGWAELGLVEAANSFDSSRGVRFTTFAHYRIKGAIYDGLRKMGWYTKSHYQRMRFEIAANEYLKDVSSEPNRPASAEAQLQELKDVTANLIASYVLSLEAMPEEPVQEGTTSAEETVVQNQQTANLQRCLSRLPKTNRKVLEYCYFEDLTLEQVGQRLGLSKSWVCRLHAKSLEMLRKELVQISGESSSQPIRSEAHPERGKPPSSTKRVAGIHSARPSATFSGFLR